MAKRKVKALTYQHERTSYKGIEERLALASLAFSETWELLKGGEYGHRVRFISKKEGWECRFNWHDNKRHIDLTEVGKHIALGIEAARERWYLAQHPTKEMQAAWAQVEAKLARKVAA
jgi:hypothetical protein